MSRTLPPLSVLSWLWILPALWIGVMFGSYALFYPGGRSAVMEARLGAGILLCAVLWWGLKATGRPATQLLGWQISREVWPLTLLVVVIGLVPLGPQLLAGDFASQLQPALIEETLFRGFVFGVLAAVTGPTRALWWSALMFGALHLFEGIGVALGASVAGLFLLGTARLATGNIVAPLMMHAVMNAGHTATALLIWTVAVVGSGLVQARQRHANVFSSDPFLHQGERLAQRLGHSWLAWPLAFEVQLWKWRTAPPQVGEVLRNPAQSPLPGMLAALIALLVLEGFAVHFMVRGMGDANAAYLISALEIYSICWIAAFRRQVQQRPTVLLSDRLLVRTGLLWTAEVPRHLLATVEQVTAQTKEAKHLSPLESANLRLTLRSPIVCRSVWGIAVATQAISCRVDAPERVIAWAAEAPTDL